MMNAGKLKALILSAAAAALLVATPALADGGDRHNRHGHYQAHHHGHGHKHGHYKKGHGHKHGHYKKGHKHRHGYRQAYKKGYKKGYKNGRYHGHGYKPYYGYKRPYYRPYSGSSFSFYYSSRPSYSYARPVYVAPAPRVVYSQPTPTTTVVTQPVTQVSSHGTAAASTCLMTREYQTEIVVGNQVVPGYGDACLQPDGSWLRLPAKPVPQY